MFFRACCHLFEYLILIHCKDDWKRSVNSDCCDGGFCLVDPNTDWETSPPLCILCKKEVSMDLNQALQYNANAKMELEDKAGAGTRSPIDTVSFWAKDWFQVNDENLKL
ncbi:hypothetical protein Y032_0018g3656 [Ancylostoma ceylanicum]|uniref:Uncharacterized protein n=1 Tax=Ancylostoma ceylanicum TaxID=53326 RepID=A0A016V439_9BILA|nr:hypothetical protein Y032_0018g3656 [Ancylostoma ceylanicum]